jgi:uncharacterized protein YciI
MPYLIDTVIPAARLAERDAVRPDHLAYLEANVAVLLAAGAKLKEDGSVGEGSFYLVDVETRDEAERFIAGDPYAKVGLIASMTLTRVRTGFFDRARAKPAASRH